MSHSHLVRRGRAELVAHHAVLVEGGEQVVVRGRAGLAGLAVSAFLLVVAGGDAGDLAEPVHTVLPDGDRVLLLELVGQEPVAQCRVVGVQLVQHVDEVGVVPVPLGHRLFEPLVVPLGRQPQDPARHRDRHPDPHRITSTGRGHLTDEREDYFAGRFAWDR